MSQCSNEQDPQWSKAGVRAQAESRPESIGGYRLEEVLGEGPTGVVHRCVAPDGAHRVIKVLHRELCHPSAMEALRADLARLSSTGEPHVAAVLDSGFTDEGRLWLVGEELLGSDLDQAMREAPQTVAPRRCVEVIRQVCLAVEAAHAVGVVHAGLKPRNVFALPGGAAKVLDFAASRRTGTAVGTMLFGDPRYMAPEQLRGISDARSDVYAIGVMLHELLSGELPSMGMSRAEVALDHLRESEAARLSPRLDESLRKLLARALDPRPASRYATVRQLRRDVELWAKDAALGEAAAFQVVREAGRREPTPVEVPAIEAPSAAQPGMKAPPPIGGKPSEVRLAEITRRPPPARPPEAAATNGHNDSVEASLEDFISQANKPFEEPAETWSLNTDEVELIEEADLAPVAPAAIAKAEKPVEKAPEKAQDKAAEKSVEKAAEKVVAKPAEKAAAKGGKANKSARAKGGEKAEAKAESRPVEARGKTPAAAVAAVAARSEPAAPATLIAETSVPPVQARTAESADAPSETAAAGPAAAVAVEAAPVEKPVEARAEAKPAEPAKAEVAAPAAPIAAAPSAATSAVTPIGLQPNATLFLLMLGVFLAGALVGVLLGVRMATTAPAVPVIVQSPPAPAPAAAPVVTPMPAPAPTAAVPAPVPTTPIAPAPSAATPAPSTAPAQPAIAAPAAPTGHAAPAPKEAAPKETAPKEAARVEKHKPVVEAKPKQAEEPAAKHAEPAAREESKRKHEAPPAKSSDDDFEDAFATKPAAKPAPKPAAKPAPAAKPKGKTGGDWVDPFSQ